MSADGDGRQAISTILQAALRDRYWSYAELAKRAGVAVGTVGNHVNGNNLAEPATLSKYALALGLPVNELLVRAGHAERPVGDKPLELVAMVEKLERVYGGLSRGQQLMLSRFIQGLEPFDGE